MKCISTIRLAVSAALVAAVAPGCGGDDPPKVRVYGSTAIVGSGGEAARGMQVALADAGGRAGRFEVELVTLDDSRAVPGRPGGWDPKLVRRNARRAVADERAVAYIGDQHSGATAISIPITNRAGLLQVSPTSSYPGLTTKDAAAPGEPDRYYPTGKRTFARVMPRDAVQAGALVEYMRLEGVRSVLILDDGSTYGVGLGTLTRQRAEAAGIEVVPLTALREGPGSPQSIARGAVAQGVDALFYSGDASASDIREFARGAPEVTLFLPDGSVAPPVWTQLEEAEDQVRFTAPEVLATAPPERREFVARYRDRFGVAPSPQAFLGYEAMAAVLAAIERAGEHGDERAAVLRELFRTRGRRSPLGTYSIDANGDTTLRRYGAYRVDDRRLILDHILRPPSAARPRGRA